MKSGCVNIGLAPSQSVMSQCSAGSAGQPSVAVAYLAARGLHSRCQPGARYAYPPTGRGVRDAGADPGATRARSSAPQVAASRAVPDHLPPPFMVSRRVAVWGRCLADGAADLDEELGVAGGLA